MLLTQPSPYKYFSVGAIKFRYFDAVSSTVGPVDLKTSFKVKKLPIAINMRN